MTEAELDNELSLLLSTVSELVGVDGAEEEHRKRWTRVQAKFPRTAGSILALMQAELARYIAQKRTRVPRP